MQGSFEHVDRGERAADLVNPVTGDRLWFERLPSSADATLVFRCELPGRSSGTPLHFHRVTDERFEGVSGELAMCVGGKHNERRLARGDGIDVPRGTVHRFWNPSDSPVIFRSSATPGRDFCRFLETVYGLGIDGRVGKEGMPRNPLQVAVVRELADLYFPGVPLAVQRPVFGVLSALSTVTGVRGGMRRYWKHVPPGGVARGEQTGV